MGNCCTVEGAVDHWIFIKTGDRKNGQTEISLRASLHDDRGNESGLIPLNCHFSSNFERGSYTETNCPVLSKDFGRVKLIKVERADADRSCNWFCEAIVINDRRKGVCIYFPVLRWLRSGIKYEFYENDTYVTQYDPGCKEVARGAYSGIRVDELEDRKLLYQFGQLAQGTPLQVIIAKIRGSDSTCKL